MLCSPADGRRAHVGSVLAIAVHEGVLWTSGGGAGGPVLREWNVTGQAVTENVLGELGKPASGRVLLV